MFSYSRPQTITVSDRMQTGYTYTLTEPEGGGPDGWKNAAKNGANWSPDFKPDLTPAEMLKLGVFGGRYMRDCRDEFPAEWFRHAKLHPEGTPGHPSPGHSPELNFFGVDASQPLLVWQAKGWIHPDDPRGWFQWYCRYYMGRRLPDTDGRGGEDAKQIKRWKAMRRHIAQIALNCRPGDLNCRRKQRQALLHWGYDGRRV